MTLWYQWYTGLVVGIEHLSDELVEEAGDEWCIVLHLGVLRIFLSKQKP
jgi:hypothetical protein